MANMDNSFTRVMSYTFDNGVKISPMLWLGPKESYRDNKIAPKSKFFIGGITFWRGPDIPTSIDVGENGSPAEIVRWSIMTDVALTYLPRPLRESPVLRREHGDLSSGPFDDDWCIDFMKNLH